MISDDIFTNDDKDHRYLSQNNLNIKELTNEELVENNIEIIDDNKISNRIDKILEDIQMIDENEEQNEELNDEQNEEQNDEHNEEQNDEYNEEQNEEQIEEQNQNDIINPANLESHKKEKSGFMRLPLAKIKNMMKLDDEIKLCQKNAYYVVGKLTELFIQELAKNAHSVAKLNKRKTMNLEDISCAIKSIEKYNFIDISTIFNIETIEDLRIKEERFEKRSRQQEIKTIKKKETKSEKNTRSTKSNKLIGNKNKTLDQMFSRQNN